MPLRSLPPFLAVVKDSRVLDVGCGDKPLAYDMRDAGYTGQITRYVCIVAKQRRRRSTQGLFLKLFLLVTRLMLAFARQ